MLKSQEDYIRQFLRAIVDIQPESITISHVDWLQGEAKSLLEWIGPGVAELQEKAETLETNPVVEDSDGRTEWHKKTTTDGIPMREGDKEIVSRTLRGMSKPLAEIGNDGSPNGESERALREFMESEEYKNAPGRDDRFNIL